MANGSTKDIEKIKIGESVATFNEKTGEKINSTVTEVLHHAPREQLMYEFTFDNKRSFKVTAEHLIYTLDGNYMPAVWIAHDHETGKTVRLLDVNGTQRKVITVKITSESVPTYNIHVKGISERDDVGSRNGVGHNYFASGVLVHNLKWCCTARQQECLRDSGTELSCGCSSETPMLIMGTGQNCRTDGIGSVLSDCWEGQMQHGVCVDNTGCP